MKSLNITFPARGVVTVNEEEVPTPRQGEILCAATTSLVSTGTESFCLAGEFDPGTFWEHWVTYPFAPGYSMVSVVTETGPDVAGVRVGDRVATSTPHHQRFVLTATEALVVPRSITDDQATWAALACTTQLGVRRAKPEMGETAVVVGLGLLGQLVVQYLRLCGQRHIIAVDATASRVELAQRHGATVGLVMSAADARIPIRDLTGDAMADLAFDITGHNAVLSPTSELLRPGGRLVLLGDSPTPSQQPLGPRIVADSISILGVHASSVPSLASPSDPWTLSAMARFFFELVATSRMNVDDLVTHRFQPMDAPTLYERLRVDRASYLAVLLDWPRVDGNGERQ